MGVKRETKAYIQRRKEERKLREACEKVFSKYDFQHFRAIVTDLGCNPRFAASYAEGRISPTLPLAIKLSKALGFDLDEIDPYIKRGIHFARLIVAPGAKNWILPGYAKRETAKRIEQAAADDADLHRTHIWLYTAIKFGQYFDGIGLGGEGLEESSAKIETRSVADQRVFRWIVRNFGWGAADTMQRESAGNYTFHGNTFYDYRIIMCGQHIAEWHAYWRETGNESTFRRIMV